MEGSWSTRSLHEFVLNPRRTEAGALARPGAASNLRLPFPLRNLCDSGNARRDRLRSA
jgi:hypothetical protein